MTSYEKILTDDPAVGVRRITLNRPEKRNALDNTLRGEVFHALEAADRDEDIRVSVLRGAGTCFSAGYDLRADNSQNQPYYTSGGDSSWSRHVVEGWFHIWDLAKPVIAQVHGYCLAGGSELATACDLVYVAEDAQIGYPPVRLMSALTGDAISGEEAVRIGFANRAFPLDGLEKQVLGIAERIAGIPTDLQQLNKRSVHQAMEIMGMRTALRAGTQVQALGFHQRSSRDYFKQLMSKPLTEALSERDRRFGDYRTRDDD